MRGWSIMQASRDEACHAVEMYNRPAAARSYETFVVHMHLAWLYLLQAVARRDGIDYRYVDTRGGRRRIVRVDGEPKTWELDRHVSERWPDPRDPVRANLKFFIALRNKIEHRYTRSQEALAIATGGHAHALLVNYEAELTSQFGFKASLAHRLRFPVFVGTFTEDGEQLLREMRATLPAPLRRFLANYHSDLDPQVRDDSRFEFRLRLTQVTAARDSDALPMEFLRFADLDEQERAELEEQAAYGRVVVRDRLQPVANDGLLKATAVARAVQDRIPFRFNNHHLKAAYLALRVRPAWRQAHPEATNTDFCIWDSLHRDYGYKPAFVDLLVRRCSSADGFEELTGRAPVMKTENRSDAASVA
jgi:hypothetical protein